MVSHARVLAAAVVLAALAAGSTCKVLNEDHCANQDEPGNDFCRALNRATPYCSPCNRNYHGCVDFEPYACAGYPNEIGAEEDGSSGEASAGSTETDDATASSGASSG